MSWCLIHSTLKGFHSNKFQFDIRKCTLRRNFWCYHWEGCMRSMQCNVEFGYQLSICSGTKENHGKPWWSWPVAGPSGCKLTSSQQSGIKYASPNTSPYLCFFFLSLFVENIYKLFFLQKFYLHIIWIGTKPFITQKELMLIGTNMLTIIHISVTVITWFSVNLEARCILYVVIRSLLLIQ
jgi:hypothetical protein